VALTQSCIAYGDHYGMASCVLVCHCSAGYCVLRGKGVCYSCRRPSVSTDRGGFTMKLLKLMLQGSLILQAPSEALGGDLNKYYIFIFFFFKSAPPPKIV